MVFTSFEYLLLFLPIMIVGYYWLFPNSRNAGILWIIIGSLFFYATWNPPYLFLLISSILVNYSIGIWIRKSRDHGYARKLRLAIGIVFNISLLGYYKYTNFFINSANDLLGTSFHVDKIILPLAISFFTFQQIAWLMDQYRRQIVQCSFWEYMCAVAFFPHLIAGPIVRYAHLVPQFQDSLRRKVRWENIAKGIFMIGCGTFKKIVLADSLSPLVAVGFDTGTSLTLIPAWEAALSYTFQIYFDFSGYCDIAIGSAWLMNFHLPDNFRSPYKATNIRDFWRTWHMTLGDFLTRYLYIPLGGSRHGTARTCCNVFLVMFISGLWHGAGYGFILWGMLHGGAMVIQRLWSQAGCRLHWFAGRVVTFLFIVLAWVFFRATDMESAIRVYKGLLGLNGISLPEVFEGKLPAFLPFRYINAEALLDTATSGVFWPVFLLLASFALIFFGREVLFLWERVKPERSSTANWLAWTSALLLFVSFCKMIIIPHTEFIYFNF